MTDKLTEGEQILKNEFSELVKMVIGFGECSEILRQIEIVEDMAIRMITKSKLKEKHKTINDMLNCKGCKKLKRQIEMKDFHINTLEKKKAIELVFDKSGNKEIKDKIVDILSDEIKEVVDRETKKQLTRIRKGIDNLVNRTGILISSNDVYDILNDLTAEGSVQKTENE